MQKEARKQEVRYFQGLYSKIIFIHVDTIVIIKIKKQE